jgi:hypothetical protein
VDYPLGHTAGKLGDVSDQREIVEAALDLLRTATAPGRVVDLERVWSSDASWKKHPLSSKVPGGDGRTARTPEPVYQSEGDRALAIGRHRAGVCDACVGADPGDF